MLSVAFLMCGTSYASPSNDYGALNVEQVSVLTLFTVESDLVPAVKPNNDGFVIAMAGDPTDISYFKLKTDKRISNTAIACGYESEPVSIPAKIPISI